MNPFSTHPRPNRLLAFAETGADSAVAAHVARCARCRAEIDALRRAAAALRPHRAAPVPAPPEIWDRIAARLDAAEAVRPRKKIVLRLAFVAATAAVIFGAVFFLRSPSRSVVSWPVAWETKRPGRQTRLAVGERLETDAASRATLTVATIGTVEVAPNSRLRLVASRKNEHRLALERGTLSATILAPPRLFFVETPSAVAVDLGCAYTLSVDERGTSRLRVSAGWVALAENNAEIVVPAGAACASRPAIPYFEDAAPALIAAVARNDRDAVLSAPLRPRDSLTLWYLLRKTTGRAERARIVRRLARLVPLPEPVSPDAVVDAEPAALAAVKERLENDWTDPNLTPPLQEILRITP